MKSIDELRNPVGYITPTVFKLLRHRLIHGVFKYSNITPFPYPAAKKKIQNKAIPLYSQEYVEALNARIAELEARTVKLPHADMPLGFHPIVVAASDKANAMRSKCIKAIKSAGVKVEGE